MISYIRGELVALEEDKVIVDVGGVGYGIFMSGQAMGQLPPVGSKVKIHTYLNVKEDAMQLYGFLNRDALSVFKLLIGVSGIGTERRSWDSGAAYTGRTSICRDVEGHQGNFSSTGNWQEDGGEADRGTEG